MALRFSFCNPEPIYLIDTWFTLRGRLFWNLKRFLNGLIKHQSWLLKSCFACSSFRSNVSAPGCRDVNKYIYKHVMCYGNVLASLCADGAEPPTSCGGSREEVLCCVCVCVYTHASHSCARTEDLPSWGPSTGGRIKPRDTLPSLKQHTNCFFPSFMALDLCFLSTHQIRRHIRNVFLVQVCDLLCCLPVYL